MNGITDSMDMSLSKLWEIVKAREACRAAIHGIAENQTQLSDWKTTNCISRAEARDAAKYLTVHGTAPTEESSRLKSQQDLRNSDIY